MVSPKIRENTIKPLINIIFYTLKPA